MSRTLDDKVRELERAAGGPDSHTEDSILTIHSLIILLGKDTECSRGSLLSSSPPPPCAPAGKIPAGDMIESARMVRFTGRSSRSAMVHLWWDRDPHNHSIYARLYTGNVTLLQCFIFPVEGKREQIVNM